MPTVSLTQRAHIFERTHMLAHARSQRKHEQRLWWKYIPKTHTPPPPSKWRNPGHTQEPSQQPQCHLPAAGRRKSRKHEQTDVYDQCQSSYANTRDVRTRPASRKSRRPLVRVSADASNYLFEVKRDRSIDRSPSKQRHNKQADVRTHEVQMSQPPTDLKNSIPTEDAQEQSVDSDVKSKQHIVGEVRLRRLKPVEELKEGDEAKQPGQIPRRHRIATQTQRNSARSSSRTTSPSTVVVGWRTRLRSRFSEMSQQRSKKNQSVVCVHTTHRSSQSTKIPARHQPVSACFRLLLFFFFCDLAKRNKRTNEQTKGAVLAVRLLPYLDVGDR